jgi:NADH:ubiquinone oxidoreductase subunit C/predicted flap endonuclease-1-like 5' DNA nuclease
MTLANTPKITPLEASAVDRFRGNLKARAETALDETVMTVAVEDYRALCERLHLAGFDFPRCLSGTDMDWGLGVTLHLQSLETKQKVAVRTYVSYDHPRVPTVCDLWGGVEWHEREAYDLLGIHFDGHPDLRRILTEDHWTIHPLQRRYDTRGYLMSDWHAKPWPSPAPWEDGFTPFAAAAPAAHAAPAKAAAPAAPKAAAAPAAETPKAEPPQAAAPSSESAPAATAPSDAATSSTPTDATKPAPTKERKKWEPKGGSSAPAATEPSSTPATGDASSTPAGPSATEASSTAPVEPPTASVPTQNTIPDAKQETPSQTVSVTIDDLKRIEGIGPKINEALIAAGVTRFAQLAAMNQDRLKSVLENAGLSHPSVPTWAEQALLLAKGDEAGFKALTDRLVAGRREDSSTESPAASSAEAPTPAAETPAVSDEPEKPRNPKIKRWEPKS